jgi:hypothetical protein
MKTLTSRIVLVASILLSSAAFGQVTANPDAALWGGGATNPSGDSAVPIFQYDPATGSMWISTVGLNGTADTTTRTAIEADDVGLISVSIEGPEAISTAAELNGFNDGVVWNGMFFNGKQQVFGVGAGAEFLAPTEGLVGWTYATGLTEADFGTVEVAVNFATGTPGATIFGGVQIVPEPSAVAIALPALLCLLGLVRRRRNS